jgi:hypothetical protein
MSTNCSISVPGNRYVTVHFDGYPSHVVPALRKFYERNGLDGTHEALSAHGEWRSLTSSEDFDDEAPLGTFYEDGADEPFTCKGNWQEEWDYLLMPFGVVCVGDSVKVYPWEPETEFSAQQGF